MTRFRDVKVCKNLVADEIDDHRIQSDYKCTIGLQNPEGKDSTLGIAYAWWNRATGRTTPMTTWPPRPRALSTHSAHEHWHLNTWIDARVIPCAHSPEVRFWSSWPAHHIVAQVLVVRISHVIHACSERYSSTLSSPFHPISSSSHSPSISCSSSCTSSTSLRAIVTLCTSPKRRWSLMTSPTSPHGGGDVAAKMKMVICGSCCADPTKTKVIDRVVRSINILGAPVSYLPNEDGKLIDTGQIIIAQIPLECKNDINVMMDGYTLMCAKPATLEKFLDTDHEIGRD